jgi:hypothetical protein
MLCSAEVGYLSGIMKSLRIGLLAAAAFLMLFGAISYTLVLLPDLHGDLIEIGVRRSVLGTTVFHLRFAAAAMFAFALMVCFAAVEVMRSRAIARLPLTIIAIVYMVFGATMFAASHNPHHLGPVAMGVLLGAALLLPAPSL